MGRVNANVTITNLDDPKSSLQCTPAVDTGAAFLTLPKSWQNRLGHLPERRTVTLQLGDHSTRDGEVCGPVRIEIEGFEAFSGEVLFLEMAENDLECEPLLGCIPLEQCQAAVDVTNHRLMSVKYVAL